MKEGRDGERIRKGKGREEEWRGKKERREGGGGGEVKAIGRKEEGM